MTQVNISVNGRDYQIACEDGEEEHIAHLAQYINHQVDNLVGRVGQVGEARLLLMAALVLADELSDAYTQIDAHKEGGVVEADGEPAAPVPGLEAIEALAERLERIAQSSEIT